MSLIVWMPLNGDFHNQGLGSVSPLSLPNVQWGEGKLGPRSLSLNKQTSNEVTIPELNGVRKFSISVWWRLNESDTATAYNYASFFRVHMKVDGADAYYRIEHTNNSTQSGYVQSLFPRNNNNFTPGYTGYGAHAGVLYNWNHETVVYDGIVAKWYLNGSLAKTMNTTDIVKTDLLLTGKMQLNNATVRLQDLRIYDHCLSPEEVYDISKGLLIHYPLSDPYEERYTNLYGEPYCSGAITTKSAGVSTTKKVDSDGNIYYNFTGTHAASSTGNTWYSFCYPNYQFTAGKSYLVSIKARRNSCSNITWTMRHARLGNDYFGCKTCAICNSTSSTGWKEYYLIQVIPESFVYSDTTKVCVPRLEFYTENLASKESSFDFDIKDVMVVESDHWLPFINGNTGGTICDTSGYGNHGIVESSTCPLYDMDSAIGKGSLKFADSSKILSVKPCFDSGEKVSMLTITCWFKTNTKNGTAPNIVCLGQNSFVRYRIAGDNANSLWSYSNVNGIPQGITASCKTLTDGQWHLSSYTFNNGIVSMYIDGQKISTTDFSSTGTELLCNNITSWILAGYTNTSEKFVGNLSDFRVYATALSDEDISSLYHRRFQIGTEADFHCAEIEEISSTSFGKNGVLSCPEIVEMYALKCPINGTSWEYTPSTGTNSTLIGFRIPQDTFKAGDTIAVEFDIEWSGFDESNENGTFAIRLQGAMRSQDGTSNWVSNPYTNALSSINLKSLVLGSASGYYHYKAITAALTETNLSYAGADVGIRSDYSNGTAHIKISNPHVYNTKNYLDSQKTLLSQDRLLSKIFIEE